MFQRTQKWQFYFSRGHCCEVTAKNVRKSIFSMFWATNQWPLELVKFQCSNWVPWNVSYKKHILLVTNVLQFLKTMHKQSKNWSGVQYPLKASFCKFHLNDSSSQYRATNYFEYHLNHNQTAWSLQIFIWEGLEARGGALNFFSCRGVRPGFPKCGACELTFASEKGGLWAENFQIWGLVSWKFPNLGACELKISKFGGLWAKIWVKIEAVEAKISKFSQKGVLWTDSFAWNGTLASGRRGVKRGSSGPHIPIPPF